MKRIGSMVLVVLTILFAFTACAGPAPNETEFELKYDSGDVGGDWGIGGPGMGVIVEFTLPSVPFKMSEIKISGQNYGSSYENRKFDILIWDKNQKKLWKKSFSHKKFENPGWVGISVSGVRVSDNFYVVVVPNAGVESGLYLHYSRGENKRSGMVENWEIVDWYLELPEEEVNWMIRVIGTAP